MEVRRLLVITGVVLLFCAIFFIGVELFPLDSSESINSYKDDFSGIVKECDDGMAGSKIVTFEDEKVFNIHSLYESDTPKGDQLKLKEWEQNSITYLLQPGDSVFKTKNSDTIFVYRNDIVYIFINRYIPIGSK